MLEAALAYLRLATANLQASVTQKERLAAERLLKMETLRVAEGVDDPVVLTRAKLAVAWTNMRQAAQEASQWRLREQLSYLTGLSQPDIEPLLDSIPLFADLVPGPRDVEATNMQRSGETRELEAIAKELAFARDVAQLDYVLARRETTRSDMRTEIGQASPSDQALAYINEYATLNALLDATLELQSVQLRLLSDNNRLEEWAVGYTTVRSESLNGRPFILEAPQLQGLNSDKTTASVASMMIVPAVSVLAAGQTRQYSAILMYSDGTAKVASEAVWRCSSNWTAIVSTSGLVTALSPGEVTVTATVSGLSEPWTITVKPDDHRVY